MLTSGRTCMPTLSCLVAPPSRSRSLLPQRGSTLSGSVAPSWLPSPPSNRCGSPSKSTTSAAHPLSTGSASKLQQRLHCYSTRAKPLLDSTFQLLVHSVPFLATKRILFEIWQYKEMLESVSFLLFSFFFQKCI